MHRMLRRSLTLVIFFFVASLICSAQTELLPETNRALAKIAPPSAGAATAGKFSIPRFIRYTGTARDAEAQARTYVTGVTFAIYAGQEGGAPLWQETQNVKPD